MSVAPRYAPEFRVLIDGAPVPAALRASMAGLTVQSGLEGADRVELTLVNEGLRWLDHPLLALDRVITVSMGYAPGPLSQMFVGEVVGHQASFPSTGAPTLTVVAQDRRFRMQRGNRTRWFAIPIPTYGNQPIPDPVVAAAIAAEHQMIPIVDPIGAALAVVLGGVAAVASAGDPDATQRVIRKQDGQSDYDFLAQIALENGWEMLVDHSGPLGGSQLRFTSALDHLEPDVTLTYGRDLLEFTPRLSTVGQIAGVKATIWQPDIKMAFGVSVGWDWDRQSLDISITPGAAASSGRGDEATFTMVDQPVTRADAARTLVATLLPRLNKRLTGSGATIGNPAIRPAAVLSLRGIGERFGGLYRVTSVTQTLDAGGWKTTFDVRKEVWFGSIPLPDQGAVPVRVTA